jgi:hypothetical protein
MEKAEFIEAIRGLYEDGVSIIVAKNADYATGTDPFNNFRRSEQMGVAPTETAILVRILDKEARLVNLLNKGGKNEVKGETLFDTLIDIINYYAILYAYLLTQERFKK